MSKFWDATKNWIKGDGGFDAVLKGVNWSGVGKVAGSYFLSDMGFTKGSPDQGGGYQGHLLVRQALQ